MLVPDKLISELSRCAPNEYYVIEEALLGLYATAQLPTLQSFWLYLKTVALTKSVFGNYLRNLNADSVNSCEIIAKTVGNR
jgi:hypothetical protein